LSEERSRKCLLESHVVYVFFVIVVIVIIVIIVVVVVFLFVVVIVKSHLNDFWLVAFACLPCYLT
jgi:hypothetical protein